MTHPAIHIFTFGPDGACALEAVSRIRKHWPRAPLYVWEDGSDLLNQDAVDTLRSRYRAEVRPTFFERSGNLNGEECFTGMIACYAYSLESHPEITHILKVDSDTFVNRPAMLDAAMLDGVYAAAWSFKGWGFSGVASLLSREAVFEIEAYKGRVPGLPPRMNEDLASGAYAYHLAEGREVRVWAYAPDGGFAASYQYGKSAVGLEEYLRRFDIITFGSRNLIEGALSDCDQRLAAAAEMAKARRLAA